MMISTQTIVSFHLPEEAEEEKIFCQTNDMSKWQMFPTTIAISYVHKQTFFTNIKGEEK